MKKQVVEKFAVLITGAFAFISALAWNSAIQQLFKDIFGTQSTLKAMFLYAMLITIIAVLMTSWISKIAEKAKG